VLFFTLRGESGISETDNVALVGVVVEAWLASGSKDKAKDVPWFGVSCMVVPASGDSMIEDACDPAGVAGSTSPP
jgi:hypothetical protein